MHVLQLVPALELGGVERGVLDLSAGLIQRGHQVTVISSGGALVEPLTKLGARHVGGPVHRKSLASMWRCVGPVTRLVRDSGIDLLHARSRVPGWIGYAASRRSGRPFLTTCHGFYNPHLASRVMTWGRLIIVPSQALGRYVIDRFGAPPERVRVIPRGVDLAAFPLRSSAPGGEGRRPWRLGLVGRLTPIKGHEVALRAVHALRQQGLGVTLRVIGDAPAGSPWRRHLEVVAESLGISHAVEWLGVRQDVAACLAELDVALVPSTYPESFGRSALEAQAVGVPVVASAIGGLAELIQDGVTGRLAPPGDPVALAAAIRHVLDDPEGRRHMVAEARQIVEERFTVERMVQATCDLYDEVLNKPRVLVWKLSAAGDMVLATPSLRAIRRQFPEAAISLVVSPATQEIVARCPYVDELIMYHSGRKDRTWAGKWRFAQRLRRAAFDRSIDLQNSRATHALAWLGDVPVRIGYDRRWGRLLTQRVPLPKQPVHPVAHQRPLLEAAGVALDDERPELWMSEADGAAVDALLRELGVDASRPIVALHPGGSPRWHTKRWNLDRWAAVATALARRGAQVVVIGGPEERALAERLAAMVGGPVAIATGRTTLLQAAALLRRCRVLLAHDSAPVHLAAAVGTPVVALFGPTDPARHLVPLPTTQVVRKPVFCSPCYSPRCKTLTHACMARITVEEVLAAAVAAVPELAAVPEPSTDASATETRPARLRAARAKSARKPADRPKSADGSVDAAAPAADSDAPAPAAADADPDAAPEVGG